MQEIQIRPLLKKDQKRIAGMLESTIDKIDDKSITNIITSSSGATESGEKISDAQRKANITRVFTELLKKISANMYDELNAFFADLIGVTPEQYEEMPIDIDVRVLQAIVGQKDVENFFSGALQLYSRTQVFKGALSSLRAKFDSVSAAMQKNLTK